MRRIPVALALLVLAVPVFAGAEVSPDPVSSAVDRLFDPDAKVRARAREELLHMGAKALPALLDRVEARVAPPAPERSLRIYDVRDLADGAPATKELVARVRSLVGKGAQVKAPQDGQLLVTGAAADLARVEGLLATLREGRRDLVHIETRIFRTPAGSVAAPAPGREGPGAAPAGDCIAAPVITCYDRQQGTLSVARPVSWVKDYEVRAQANGKRVASPVIGEGMDGVTIEVRPEVGEDGIALRYTFRVSRIPTPMPAVRRAIPGFRSVDIQVPEVRTSTVSGRVVLRPGDTALLDMGNDPAGGRLFLELKAGLLHLDGGGAPTPKAR